MSNNEPFRGINSNSCCFPLGFQHFLPSSYPLHNWSLADGYSRSESLSVPLEQKKYDRMVGSQESNSVVVHELFEQSSKTSSDSEDMQSVIMAGFYQEQRRKNGQQTPLNTSDECSSSCNHGSEIKNYNRSKDTKKRNVNSTSKELKDDKYWERRQRNNLAAKKSRDAKRRHEDSVVQKVAFLEIENSRLRLELSCVRDQNERLKRLVYQSYPVW